MLFVWEGNHGPGGKYEWQPTARFMAPVTCGLTAEDREQLQTPYEGEEFGP